MPSRACSPDYEGDCGAATAKQGLQPQATTARFPRRMAKAVQKPKIRLTATLWMLGPLLLLILAVGGRLARKHIQLKEDQIVGQELAGMQPRPTKSEEAEGLPNPAAGEPAPSEQPSEANNSLVTNALVQLPKTSSNPIALYRIEIGNQQEHPPEESGPDTDDIARRPDEAHYSSWVGVLLRSSSFSDERGRAGVIVHSVLPRGPAERAGIRTGDIIFAIDDTPISGANHFRDVLHQKRGMVQLNAEVLREGSLTNFQVRPTHHHLSPWY